MAASKLRGTWERMAVVALAALMALPGASVGALVPGSGALPAAPELPAAALPFYDQAMATRDAAEAFTAAMASDVPFGDRLLRASLRPDLPTSLGPLPEVSLDGAFAALYAQGGLPPPPLAPVPSHARQPLAQVVYAAAVAAGLVEEALVGLSQEERAFLMAELPRFGTLGDPASDGAALRLAELAARVDMDKMVLGAGYLANAMDAYPQGLSWGTTEATTCVDLLCWVLHADSSSDLITTEHVLIIDEGGLDTYKNRPGSYGPYSIIPVPVSAILDLGGSNTYLLDNADKPGGSDLLYGEGVGILGIGLILDVDETWWPPQGATFSATMTNTANTCTPDPSTSFAARQMLLAQGVGVLGVGAISSQVGVAGSVGVPGPRNVYLANNTAVGSVSCHDGRVHTYAQGVGLHLGVGALLDDGGQDDYKALAEAGFVDDNSAHVVAQGAGAGAVGVLVDHPSAYDATALDGYTEDFFNATASAHVGTTPTRIKGAFAYTFAQGAVFSTRHLGSICPGGSLQLCNSAGAGILVNVGGRDAYVARATTREPIGCSYTDAVVVGQGAAAWAGLGLLVATDDRDTSFLLDASATGGCGAGANAYAHGQGFGGDIFWDRRDPPTFPLLILYVYPFGGPAVGALVSSEHEQGSVNGNRYEARSNATSLSTCFCHPAWAETWAQGAGRRTTVMPGMYLPLGVGLLVNTGSGAAYIAESSSTGSGGGATTWAQAASSSGTGILVGAGFPGGLPGDTYSAKASRNGVAQRMQSNAQGYADSTASASFGVLIDLLGADTYSESLEPGSAGCQHDLAVWGDSFPTCSPNTPSSNGFTLGVDVA